MPRSIAVLTNLHCFATEDDGGTDELYMTANGHRFWPDHGIFSMSNGEDAPNNAPMHLEQIIPPGGSVRIELFDADSPDQDDNLGAVTIREFDAGHGDLTADFTADEAHYRLTYHVE
ncbi:hypothetical protein GCM10010384_31630 [Streptomyces djakartensis]|uniref:Uncharacterized protein n=1 Tax=Streptomyces djakartensis TaxID=68193 RepID=A0ABQ2ZQD6_9ACTN|nr:hypothetical protein GCM10010384_31630 [Streptomyces djakartensis]